MDFEKLKEYLKKLYSSTPAGAIGGATAAGAQAAGVPAGASPLTDAIAQHASAAGNQAGSALQNALPQPVASGVNTANSYLDMLHDKLFQLFGRTGQASGR